MEHIQVRQSGRDPFTHRLTMAVLMFCNGLAMVYGSLLLLDKNFDLDRRSTQAGLIVTITAIIGTLLLSDGVRVVVGGVFPKREDFVAMANQVRRPVDRLLGFGMPMMRDGEMIVDHQVTAPTEEATAKPEPNLDKPELLGFDPYNTVHMVALVFAVFVLGFVFATFLLSGEQDVSTSAWVFAISVIIQFGILVGGSLLGVGLFFRRSWSATLQRLGLDEPSSLSIGVGVITAFGCLVALFIMAVIWVSIVGIDKYEAQNEAAEAVADSISTIWLVLLVSVTSSVGEEIAFRGALQPIFGLWPTAVFFVLIHSQYLLTPATFILFVPALAFGYLRRYYGLYAAIAAHFTFNFIQLIIPYLFG
jgi:membrane protease YdiL (CAAX protease family)